MKRRKIRSKVQLTSNRPNVTSAHTDRPVVLTVHEMKIDLKYSSPKKVFNTNFVEISCPWQLAMPYSHRDFSSSQWMDQFVVFWDLGSVLTVNTQKSELKWGGKSNVLKVGCHGPTDISQGVGSSRQARQAKTFNVNKSYFCHFVLLSRRMIISKESSLP